jgi:hypothetical protein
MKKFFVRWAITDYYGYTTEEDKFNWYETKEEAEAFIADQKYRNGGYFKVRNFAEGDYARFQKREALRAEMEALKAEFEKMDEEF